MIELRCVQGPALGPWLPAVAALRIEVFREYPYLYDGDFDYERRYLETYLRSAQALVVLALDGEQVVGASTGIPLRDELPEIREPFETAGFPVASVFYFGESVLLGAYRGQGIGHRFFDAREAHALASPGIRYTAFCAVERAENHPLRPASHRTLDAFWQSRGYRRIPAMQAWLEWKDIDQPASTSKPLTFWLRDWSEAEAASSQ